MKRKIIFGLSVAFLMSSCATIVSGSRQVVKFDSTPTAATIIIDGVERGKTPFETKLRRADEHTVVIKLEGFKTYETKLTKKFNAWYLGNIIFGGLIGVIVDPLTGAIYSLSPNKVHGELNSNVTSVAKSNDLYIGIALELDPSWEKVGQLEKL
jgi:hypothetical protein